MSEDMTEKLPLNPGVELLRWGPIPGRAYYQADCIVSIFGDLQKRYPDELWPEALILYRDGQMLWLEEFPAVRSAGLKVFLKYMLPEEIRGELYSGWLRSVDVLHLFEAALDGVDMSRWEDIRLKASLEEFLRVILDFWAPTFIQELANYSSDRYLEEKLRLALPDESLIGQAMELLTAPEQSSFFQEEEMDLAETDDIERHRERYFWLKNSYAGIEVLSTDFFVRRKAELDPALRRMVTEEKESLRVRRAEFSDRYGLSTEIQSIAAATRAGIEWQDERKRQIFIIQHYKDLFRRELARRYGCDPERILDWGLHEVIGLLEGSEFAVRIGAVRNMFGYHCAGTSFRAMESEETERYWSLYAEEFHEGHTEEVRGVVASTGGTVPLVRGRVRVVRDPSKAENFREGEILVASMTSPDYVFVMRRSAAIVTDTGGLTSHAAIVSRELGVPCIVGTRFATQLFHDGDLVEVDADNGVVRVIERADDILNEDWTKVWTTEYSMVSVWLFGREYIDSCRKEVGDGFRNIIFSVEGDLATVFRLEGEQKDFARKMAEKIVFDDGFRGNTEKILIETQAGLEALFELPERTVLAPENLNGFFDLHRRYLPYYIGVLWAPNALESFEVTASLREEIFVWCEAVRKRTESVYLTIEKFLQRLFLFIGEREGIDAKLLRAILPEELLAYVEGGGLPSEDILKWRYDHAVVFARERGSELLVGQAARLLIERISVIRRRDTDIIRGTSAYRGMVRGRVRCVFTEEAARQVEAGDILVTTMTRPEWVSAMSLAAGYVTDAGGVLCHAAIVARELRKPCIIGTKVATQILHDGDLVEVDADHGVVRRA